YRVKRSAMAGENYRAKVHNKDVTIQRLDDPESYVDMDIPLAASGYRGHSQSANTPFARTERGRIYLRCPSLSRSPPTVGSGSLPNWHKCAEIQCHLSSLEKGDTVRLRWSGWLWAATYFTLHTPDVQLISRLRVANWGQPPESIRFYQLLADSQQPNRTELSDLIQLDYPDPWPAFELKQSIIFRNVQPDVIHQVPWWPIVVGIVIGILLLTALGICCYCCGFFRRKRIPSHKEQKKNPRGTRSSSKDRLLSTNGDETDNNDKSSVPSFLSTKPPTESAISAIPGSRSTANTRINRHRKAPDQTEFLVQASPNLLCAEEPEPPSPKIPKTYVAPPGWEVEEDNDVAGMENWSGTGEISYHANEIDPLCPENEVHGGSSLHQLKVGEADELIDNTSVQSTTVDKQDSCPITDTSKPKDTKVEPPSGNDEKLKSPSSTEENTKQSG
ncbi:Integrin alpha-ps, partial [Fasciolopsis buskii]